MNEELIKIESNLRSIAKLVNTYRRAKDPESELLDNVIEFLGEEADKIRMIADPIEIVNNTIN